MKIFFRIGIILLIFSGCVSNKKVQMLQYDDVNVKEGEVPLDSIVRTYYQDPYEYKLQPEDVISVSVESLSPEEYNFFGGSSAQIGAGNNLTSGLGTLFGEIVDYEGNIEFPVVGKIYVQGLTIFEVQVKIQKLAMQFLEDPVVRVRMLNFRFTVLGEVNREGTVSSYNNRISVLEGLGLAGGMSELADRQHVKLIRQVGGQVDVQYLNLNDEKFIDSPYYFLTQNDILVVPPLKQRPFRRYFGPNAALIISTLSIALLVIDIATR